MVRIFNSRNSLMGFFFSSGFAGCCCAAAGRWRVTGVRRLVLDVLVAGFFFWNEDISFLVSKEPLSDSVD